MTFLQLLAPKYRIAQRVGIITPYKAQVRVIKDLVCPWLRKSGLKSTDIEINTVDAYQGREKEIVIFSCVRTEGLGFLADLRRMNVAITRAREYLFVFGHSATLSGHHVWASFIKYSTYQRVSANDARDTLKLLFNF